MTALLQALGEPGPEYRPNVGIMLLNREGLVFVAQRIDAPSAWQMPQGGIDPGETPREAALRELEEETGTNKASILFETEGWLHYDLPTEVARKLSKGQWRGQAQKWFVMRFMGEDGDIDLNTAHPEFSSWKWVPPTALVDLIVAFKRPVYEAVLAAAESQLGPHWPSEIFSANEHPAPQAACDTGRESSF